jgi:hypothetical protein
MLDVHSLLVPVGIVPGQALLPVPVNATPGAAVVVLNTIVPADAGMTWILQLRGVVPLLTFSFALGACDHEL